MDNLPPTPPLVINSGSKKKPFLILAVIMIVIILIAGVSVLIRNYRGSQIPSLSIKNNTPAGILADNKSLTITGKITDFDGKSIVIKKDGGQDGKVEVASKVNIYRLIDGKYLSATASSNLKDIQTNKDATLILVEENGVYKVGTISYIVPINVPLPTVPISAKSVVNNP